MKKIFIVLIFALAIAGIQKADAQKVKYQKTHVVPKGKATGYTRNHPKKKTIHYPEGKAVGYKGRNPNKKRGKY